MRGNVLSPFIPDRDDMLEALGVDSTQVGLHALVQVYQPVGTRVHPTPACANASGPHFFFLSEVGVGATLRTLTHTPHCHTPPSLSPLWWNGQAAYKKLGLITFYTSGETETRAWTVPLGATAPNAAGKIHTDFEKGFIRAETTAYAALVRGPQKSEATGRVSLALCCWLSHI